MLNLTSATTLIPYLFVAAYGLMIARRGETYEVRPEERKRDVVLATLAVLYTLFMIYAGGLKYILLSALIFAPGTILYYIVAARTGQTGVRQAPPTGSSSASSSLLPSMASTVWRPAPFPSDTPSNPARNHTWQAATKSNSASIRKSASCAR